MRNFVCTCVQCCSSTESVTLWVLSKSCDLQQFEKYCMNAIWSYWYRQFNSPYDHIDINNRPNRLTTQFKYPGFKILCVVLILHYNLEWYGNSWKKTFYSQRVWIGYNIELADRFGLFTFFSRRLISSVHKSMIVMNSIYTPAHSQHVFYQA